MTKLRCRGWRRILGSLLGLIVLAAWGAPWAIRGPGEAVLVDSATAAPAPSSEAKTPATLKVVTLNLAHGRGEGFHQALQKKGSIESHLDDVARLLRRQSPDVVALQEADGPSIWSGQFDHVEYLARAAGLEHFVRGAHVQAMKLSYGTALISRLPLTDARGVTFPPSPPTPPKGFTVARVAWPGQGDFQVEVVSVHLDFSRASVRKRQVDELVDHLSGRKGPLVVMGDFNADWSDEEGPPRRLATRLKLRAYRPEATDMPTFGAKRRLDWILVSSPLEMVEYKTLPDPISDHRAVVAVLKRSREQVDPAGR